ncbi:CD276 antigen-like [Xyrichtys novacula]|uniref:CD276 antigen-like n=1 Tax=Xyrichtys novacula TaxID=13765 RepID=A0AAV1HAK9_XYRNO|nr:CD276 antigen-like [Xyrichtys novacula]
MDKCSLFLFILILPWTFDRGDAKVCTFMENCILPCTFERGSEIVIHWIQQPNTAVHSYYHGKNQLDRQHPRFKGRTALFMDQISTGNASLMLTVVTPADEGKYKCYTSTISGNKELFVDLSVEAPPREVIVKQEGNRISCSSEGIFPRPELTWSSSSPSSLTPDTPTVLPTEQQLYNISSFLTVSDSVSDLDYSCTISSGRSKKTATLYKKTSTSTSDTETTIPCTSLNISPKSLAWSFNHSENILTQNPADTTFKVSEKWKDHVKDVSETGSLILKALTSDQDGVYTCELSTAEEIHIQSTVLTVQESQGSLHAAGTAVGVVVALLLLVFGGALIYKFRNHIPIFSKKKRPSSANNGRELEVQNLKSNNEGGETV